MGDTPRQTIATAVADVFGNPALESVLTETGALFHRLRHEAERIHGQGEASSGRRAVLRGLDQLGPQTVPAMARARPVSRQYMQRIVNELSADGLVEAIVNPAHKRSSLIAITAAGQHHLREMCSRESKLLRGLEFDVGTEELEQAAQTLRRIRSHFEGPVWESRLDATKEGKS